MDNIEQTIEGLEKSVAAIVYKEQVKEFRQALVRTPEEIVYEGEIFRDYSPIYNMLVSMAQNRTWGRQYNRRGTFDVKAEINNCIEANGGYQQSCFKYIDKDGNEAWHYPGTLSTGVVARFLIMDCPSLVHGVDIQIRKAKSDPLFIEKYPGELPWLEVMVYGQTQKKEGDE